MSSTPPLRGLRAIVDDNRDERLRGLLAQVRYNVTALERATQAQRLYLAEDIEDAADLILTAAEWTQSAEDDDEPTSLTELVARREPVALMTFQNAA